MDRPVTSPKVLVAPLDWGLGHATRCIPVIRALLGAGCTVLLAGDGKVKVLLQQEFPQLRFLHLRGYNIQYASTSWGLPLKIVAQIPSLLSAIQKEKQWLQNIVWKEGLDAVVSDNRYGLHHPKIFSVFITHQLLIKAPSNLAEAFLQWLNYNYINQFDECWIPDAEGEMNLTAELSHPLNKPGIPLRYIGALSRFTEKGAKREKHLLIILSGPEPQRTLLEKFVVKQLENYTEPVVLVRGLPQAEEIVNLPANVSVYNHLPAIELEEKMWEAIFVISRCGYSTVMDLAALKKKSILIPTPGQTEQQYLAKHLMKNNFALCIQQKKFRLKPALALAQSFPYSFPTPQEKNLQTAIASLLKKVGRRRKLTT